MKLSKITKIEINEKQYKVILVIYCILNAILFLTICSKCSPIYPFNDWNDSNAFFTVGKSMANGQILYKDIFEHKGPLLYVIHIIAYFIQSHTFLGVYILEIISFSVFLYYVAKIMMLYVRKTHILWAIPLMSFIILSSYVFNKGDSAEEFCMPLIAISLYYLLYYFKNTYPNKMKTKDIIINGIIAGCVLWTKYNLLGFWFGFALFICLGLLINRKIKDAILTGIYFLLGMLIPTIPILIYFVMNGALYDMFEIYFLVNIFSYSSVQTSIINRLITILSKSLTYAMAVSYWYTITIIGYTYMIASNEIIPNKYGKIAVTITTLISIIGVYYGSYHDYYLLILMVFIIFGIIAIAKLIEKFIKPNKLNLIKSRYPIFIAVCVVLTCIISPNFKYRKVKKEELVQYQFAEIINQKPNASLLNYYFLDGGFYTVTGIVPNVKYFYHPNIDGKRYPIIEEEQNRYIKERRVDFVITIVDKEEHSKTIPHLYENYNKVKAKYDEEIEGYYMLFEKKE